MNEHKIEVGSEWVNCRDREMHVDYVGRRNVLVTWLDTKAEFSTSIKNFIHDFKPKPVERVVWMNVYKVYVSAYQTKEMADLHADTDRLFCQRVVIKDNRNE